MPYRLSKKPTNLIIASMFDFTVYWNDRPQKRWGDFIPGTPLQWYFNGCRWLQRRYWYTPSAVPFPSTFFTPVDRRINASWSFVLIILVAAGSFILLIASSIILIVAAGFFIHLLVSGSLARPLSTRRYSTQSSSPSSPSDGVGEKNQGKPARKRLSKAEKDGRVFPGEVQEVITGMLLSDWNLEKNGNDARLRMNQKDKAFVLLLWNLFNSLGIVAAAPRECSSILKETGKTYSAYQFATFTLPFFTTLFNHWYHNVEGKNVKVLLG
jgi:hypothetical protein